MCVIAHLAMRKFNGECLGMITVCLCFSALDLVDAVAKKLACEPATICISIKGKTPDTELAIGDDGVMDGDVVTITRLAEPCVHDGIMHCNQCDFQRFCHFGYSNEVAVSALCEPCGGSHDEEF